MNATRVTRFLAAATLLLAVFGFYSLNRSSPNQLEFNRPQVDDAGLIEMAVDRVRQTLRTGRPEWLAPILAEDYAARPLPAHTRVDATPGSSHLSITEIQWGPEEVRVQTILNSEKPAELLFRKSGAHWRLVATQGIDLRHLPVSQKTAPGGHVLFQGPSAQPDATLRLRPLSPKHGIDRLTRAVTQQKLRRRLFGKPYAGVLISTVTQLQQAPFVVARYVQLVTDPAWNRILYGDYEGWIKAYQPEGPGPVALNRPHGIDRDLSGRVYVADTGNHRIVVLRLQGNGNATELKYAFDFGSDELMHPYDVAWDDRGTPFDPEDDLVWVADTGRHRVIGYALHAHSASVHYLFGEAGRAAGQFFRPQALTVGRFNGVSDGHLYVADTGNRRVVRLRVGAARLDWLAAYQGNEESRFTGLDTDHWGNLYVSDQSLQQILKLSPELALLTVVDKQTGEDFEPVNFNVTFGRVDLHTEDKSVWTGYDQAFALEKWSRRSGARRFQLGIDLKAFEVRLAPELDQLLVAATLTDPGNVRLEIVRESTDLAVRQIPLGWMVAGRKRFTWDRRDDLGWPVAPGNYRVRLSAESSYGALTAVRETPAFYLPLYYHEDSGADARHDVHLAQGRRDAGFGPLPHQTVAVHPRAVVYRFTGLHPERTYELRAQFYNPDGRALWQRLEADSATVYADFQVPKGVLDGEWVRLPQALARDGELVVRVVKTRGTGPASVSQLWLREADYDPANAPVDDAGEASRPNSFALLQNYPNPFNPSTTIAYEVPEGQSGVVKLRILNVLGQTVRELVNATVSAGRHEVVWDGRDAFGRPVSSGLYLYQLSVSQVGETRTRFVAVRKLLLVR